MIPNPKLDSANFELFMTGLIEGADEHYFNMQDEVNTSKNTDAT